MWQGRYVAPARPRHCDTERTYRWVILVDDVERNARVPDRDCSGGAFHDLCRLIERAAGDRRGACRHGGEH
jgi:hypothetical protein